MPQVHDVMNGKSKKEEMGWLGSHIAGWRVYQDELESTSDALNVLNSFGFHYLRNGDIGNCDAHVLFCFTSKGRLSRTIWGSLASRVGLCSSWLQIDGELVRYYYFFFFPKNGVNGAYKIE
jgi:hypothetical protein